MFEMFKRRSRKTGIASILQLNDKPFVESVKHSILEGSAHAGCMCVIAYQNLDPILAVSFKRALNSRKGSPPGNLDEFIEFLASGMEKHAQDEIAHRRLAWFFLAALVKRASLLYLNNSAFVDELAEIWRRLAEGSKLIHSTLSTNILWDEDEMAWFSDIGDEKAGIEYCLNLLMPNELRKNDRIRAFAQEYGAFLSIL